MTEFIYNQDAKNVLSILFLQDFHAKYIKLLDKVSYYLSNYDNIIAAGMYESENLTNTIKQDLFSIVYILNSMNLDKESKNVVQKIMLMVNTIANAKIISKKQLQELLESLSKILACTFLHDLIKYVPSVEQRIRGDYD